MKKIILAIVILLAVGIGALFIAFDSILKGGIETAGSSVLKTEVTVDSVGVSPLSGSGGIQNLRIGNPEGFNEPYAMQLGGLDVGIEVGSVFSDVIVIDHIVIEQPQITYETRIRTDNIRTLLDNIGGGTGSQGAETEQAGPAKRVIIRDFQMRGTQVSVVSSLGSAEVDLPDLHLQNIGEESAAVTVAEAGRQILGALNQQLLRADLPNVEMLREEVEERVDELREQADQQVEQLEDQVENLRERARSLF